MELEKVKNFWKKEIKKYMSKDDMKITKNRGNAALGENFISWENELEKKKTLLEIENYAHKTIEEIWLKNSGLTFVIFNSSPTIEKFISEFKIRENYFQVISDEIENYNQQLTNIQDQLTSYKNKWDNHECSSGSCSHTDYNDIKLQNNSLKSQKNNLTLQITNLTNEKNNLQTERDHLKNQLNGQTDFNKIKQDLTEQIINDGELDLDKGSSLEQIIAKIKGLVKQSNLSEAEQENLENLTVEELKNKIRIKDDEINKLKDTEPGKNNNKSSSEPPNKPNVFSYTSFSLGIFTILAIGGLAYLAIRLAKKKKKNNKIQLLKYY